jgi:hypothetical protein
MDKVMQKPMDPPFDGDACPMCPTPIRNLYAVAYNLIRRWRSGQKDKAAESMEELRKAVECVQPYVDAHFADKAHCYGRRASDPDMMTSQGLRDALVEAADEMFFEYQGHLIGHRKPGRHWDRLRDSVRAYRGMEPEDSPAILEG